MSTRPNRILSRPKEADDSTQPEAPFPESSTSSQSAGPKAPPVLLRRNKEEKPQVSMPRPTKQPPPPAAPERGPSASPAGIALEKKPQLLQRSATPSEPKQMERGGGGPTLYDILKGYEFPHETAIPLVHNDLTFAEGREWVKPLRSTLDYLVVTAIGPPGSGKSTILNYLAGKSKNVEFMAEPKPFQPRKEKDEETLCTFYISPENIVFIEMAPIFNGSACVDLIQFVDKYSTLEAMTISWNLRLMRWALSVSHLVLVTGATAIEPKIIQLIHSSSTLHPMESSFGETCHPELVFVANKCGMKEGAEEEWNSICNSADVLGLGRRARLKPNAFALPRHSKAQDLEGAADGAGAESYENFRRKIYEYNQWTRSYFSEDEGEGQAKIPQFQTLGDWLTFATNCWEEMGHSSYFHDYIKLLQ